MKLQKLIWSVFFYMFIIVFSGLANAKQSVQATWSFNINGNQNTISYNGIGDNQTAAIENARSLCISSQNIDSWKNFCRAKPVKTIFSSLPNGRYIESCSNCRTEDNGHTLACDKCKPVDNPKLNLDTCNGNTEDVSNCHGTLMCSPCD
jgi:hypothetical protein